MLFIYGQTNNDFTLRLHGLRDHVDWDNDETYEEDLSLRVLRIGFATCLLAH